MDLILLKQRDEAEWDRCWPMLWKWAMCAATRFLFQNFYTHQDREDVAQTVMSEFQRALFGGRLRRIQNDDDVERWVWRRTHDRACDLRRRRRRALAVNEAPLLALDEENADPLAPAEGAVQPRPISNEARLDEIITWARQMRGGFSRREEEAYRAVVVRGQTLGEFAEEKEIPTGTAATRVRSAKLKIAAVLEGERSLLL